MQVRKAGVIGGGITVGLVVVLAGTFAVAQAITIEDERGSAINISPLVVGSAPTATPLLTLPGVTPEANDDAPDVSEPERTPEVEVVTAPEPRPAPPVAPVAPAVPVAPPIAPSVVEAPAAPQRPSTPQRPSDSDIKRWLESQSVDEALAWAKAHGWTQADIRAAMREFAPHYEGKR